MWARIDGDRVAEITDIDPAGRFHHSLEWVSAPLDVQPGWTYDGENFAPPSRPDPPASVVPEQVSRAQGKAALITAALWEPALAYADAIEDPTEKALAQVALHDTTHWRRDSPFLNAVADTLGLTSGQLDDLFIQASKIQL